MSKRKNVDASVIVPYRNWPEKAKNNKLASVLSSEATQEAGSGRSTVVKADLGVPAQIC
jgi:hypothetical protein